MIERMKLTESFAYEGATPDQVYALITDPAFRTESAEADGATEHDVTVTPRGEGHEVSIVRTMPADLPDFVKKITGSTVTVHQTEVWGGPAADGTRTADVKVEIKGQPATMKGVATLLPNGTGTAFEVDGEVKVAIPFIGKKIEPEVHKAVVSSLRHEVQLGLTKL